MAQRALGEMYFDGRGVAQDYVQSYIWFRLAASGGLSEEIYEDVAERITREETAAALLYIGYMLEKGDGVPQDQSGAADWYRLAAEQGVAAAQYALGLMYDQGRGVPLDKTRALRLYRVAAETGDPKAQIRLGVIYDEGRGVPQNFAEAMRLYSAAAAQDNAEGQFHLGVMYEIGRGVPQDYVQSFFWYSLAAQSGHAGARQNRRVIARPMTAAQVDEARKLTKEWVAEYRQ